MVYIFFYNISTDPYECQNPSIYSVREQIKSKKEWKEMKVNDSKESSFYLCF